MINSNWSVLPVGKEKSAFKLLFFVLGLSLLCRPAMPQDGNCEKRLLPVVVTDKDGNRLTTLTSADFRLDNREVGMNVLSWNADLRRHRVVILLDVSGSMHGLPGSHLWNVVMALVQHVASLESDNSEFALALFTDRVFETVDFAQGRDALKKRLDEISRDPTFPRIGKGHDTKIYDVLWEGVQMLKNPTSADSLLVITDGFDEGSKTRPDEVLGRLAGPMIRVFAVLVDPLPGERSRPDTSEFVRFVQKSGGQVFGPVDAGNAAFRDSAKSAQAGQVMAGQLGQFYGGILENNVLTIQLSAIQKQQAVRLSLTDSARHQLKKPRIFFPREIGPCPSTDMSR
jgi:hypothetical protein